MTRVSWELLIDYARQGYAASQQAEAYESTGHYVHQSKRAREREVEAFGRVHGWMERAELGLSHDAERTAEEQRLYAEEKKRHELEASLPPLPEEDDS